MAGFSLMADPNATSEFRVCRIASQAYTIGDAVDQDRTSDAVDVVPSTSSSVTFAIYGVAMETVTSSATQVLVALANFQQRWQADATNTPNTNHNYQRMVLTNKATVNNTGTDSTLNTAVFQQLGTISASPNRIVGRFLVAPAVTA